MRVVSKMADAHSRGYTRTHCTLISVTLIARFMGPTRGPSGADRTQVGPKLAPWAVLSGHIYSVCIGVETIVQCTNVSRDHSLGRCGTCASPTSPNLRVRHSRNLGIVVACCRLFHGLRVHPWMGAICLPLGMCKVTAPANDEDCRRSQ